MMTNPRRVATAWLPWTNAGVRLAGGGGLTWVQDRADLLNSLVAFWKLDEASGNRADSIGANTLTDNNTVTNAAGLVYDLSSLHVPANNEYFNIADNAAVSMGDVDFWIAAWVYPATVASNRGIISKITTTAGATYEYFLRLTSGQATLIIGNGTTSTTTTNTNTLTANQWSLIVVYHDSGNNTVGVSVGGGAFTTAAHTIGLQDLTNDLIVGARLSTDSVFDGRIGPVLMGKHYVPDASDVSYLNNSGAGRTLAAMQTYTAALTEIDGMWSWFTNPRSVYYNGKTYIGTIDTLGDVNICQLVHATGVMTAFPLRRTLQVDDHDNPSILIRDSDKRIMTWYCAHNGATIFQRISANAEDATSWGLETSLDTSLGQDIYSYPCPVQLLSETDDPIYLFYRVQVTNPGLYYSKSTDGGATWATGVRIIANGTERPYAHVVGNGTDRIDIVSTDGHPNEVATNSIYHCYYTGGNLYQTDGTLIGAIGSGPYTPATHFTKVYDGATNRAWNWDIAIDGSGYPVIVYANFVGGSADHRYRYARWNGATWDDNAVVAGGTYLYAAEAYYSGGICIDHANPNVVYVSKQVSSQWEIWKYTTADGGATWDAGTAITAGSAAKNIRPYVPVGGSPLNVLWCNGTYTTYTNYDMAIKSSPAVP